MQPNALNKSNRVSDELGQFDVSYKVQPKIWAIGGGKGGVGKSLVSSNIAIGLASRGYRVVALDFDLGGANLHTCLGTNIPKQTLSDYLAKKVGKLSDLLVKTPIPNLQLISGAQDELGIANMKQVQKNKLLSALNSIDTDYVVIDLGAGTSLNTLDFFISSQKGILVILPEPTSIENTYRFIKSIYYRRLKMVEDFLDLQPFLRQAMNAKIDDPKSIPSEMIKHVMSLDKNIGLKLAEEVSKLKFQIVMNQVRGQEDIDLGFSIQSVCKKYFGIDIEYLGFLEYDQTVWQSVKKRRPLGLEFPNSRLIPHFERITKKLLEI